jgi:hypothetical protein
VILPVIGSLPDVLKAGVFSEFASLKTVNGLPGSRPKKQTGPLADSKRAIETEVAKYTSEQTGRSFGVFLNRG